MTSVQGLHKQRICLFFQKKCPKKRTHAPNVQNRPCVFFITRKKVMSRLFQVLFLIKKSECRTLSRFRRVCFQLSQLANILCSQQKTRKVYRHIGMAIGYQITTSTQLTSCSLVHVHIKSLSKLDNWMRIPHIFLVICVYDGY